MTIEDKLQEYFNHDDYSNAIKFLNESIEVETSITEKSYLNYVLGRIFFYDKNLLEAKKHFEESIKLNDDKNYSLIYLAILYKESGLNNASVKAILKMLKQRPDFTHLLDTLREYTEYLSVEDESIAKLLNHSEVVKKVDTDGMPLISILILCYNKLGFTQKCLETLFKNTNYKNFEVIVVDNASADDTAAYLETYAKKIKFIKSNVNLGFVGGNNLASKYAEGEYIVFLNNDTEVRPNWLNRLLETFIVHKDTGAAGSKLLYPDGTLQEAGSAIFSDMNGWNYGKHDDPHAPKYNFVREVDYCSGASLMVKRELFEKLGKFDIRYSPAYCEDTDLCFAIRKMGYKVYYNPFSEVVHYEGATSGTDLSKGFKKYQIINSEKFKSKWAEELVDQFPNNPSLSYQFSNRNKNNKIFLITDIPPLPNKAAGTLRHHNTIKQMLELGYQVTHAYMYKTRNLNIYSKYLEESTMRGVEFFWLQGEFWYNLKQNEEFKEIITNLVKSFELKERGYSLIYIAFWYIAEIFIPIIREFVPDVPILVDSMDIHFLRELREAELKKNRALKEKALSNKVKELAVYSKADCITTVTESDRDILKKQLPDKSILILTDVHDPKECLTQFEDRKDIIYVGNFFHQPNADAVVYFVKEIFPLIKKKLKDVKFYIVGNNPTEEVSRLSSDDVIVVGFVPEIKEHLDKARIEVVPLRYGAGNKGKVGEALSNGLPIVTTTIGAEGMNILNGTHAYVSDDPLEFAEYVVKLYNDKTIWDMFSQNGKALVSSLYSSELMRERLSYIMSFESREAFKSKLALTSPNPPIVSIILVTYNQWEYTEKCLNSIEKFTHTAHEVIVVDNNSSDKTVNHLEKLNYIRLIKNKENYGFPVAVNQGINIALGKYVLLLNNDTIVTEGWLERLIEAAETDKLIGIVGPISNSVSGVQIDKNANYKSMNDMHIYAQKVADENKNIITFFPRLAFLCTLIKREVINNIGGLDERFAPGNFEDDDFCLRSQIAGFKTVIAKSVFIHHFGSKSFTAEGRDKYIERLKINEGIFVAKWGADPNQIWLEGKHVKNRSTKFFISQNKFLQYYNNAISQLEEGDYLFALKYLEMAVKIYKNFSKKDLMVEYTDLLNLTANLCIVTNNPQKAREYFSQELKLTPDSDRAIKALENLPS